MLNQHEVKSVQDKLLSMAKKVCGILESNHIPYMMALGTLLGAVRHKGFIPWDDDFDLFIFDDVYEEGIECLRRELPEDMFLEDEKSEPLYFHAWAHVKDLYSEVECEAYPHDSLYTHKGISIDLYRTKSMKKYELTDYINSQNKLYIERRKAKGLISPSDYEDRIAKLEAEQRRTQKMDCHDQEMIYAFITGYQRKYMNAEDVLPLQKIPFEDCSFFAPANPDKILHDVYGNYMQYPPEEKRNSHYSKLKFLSEKK